MRPLEIAANLARIPHALLEAFAGASQTSLGLPLQIHELAVLGVELARTSVLVSLEAASRKAKKKKVVVWWDSVGLKKKTYVCAWTAMLRSSGIGLKEWEKRSCM